MCGATRNCLVRARSIISWPNYGCTSSQRRTLLTTSSRSTGSVISSSKQPFGGSPGGGDISETIGRPQFTTPQDAFCYRSSHAFVGAGKYFTSVFRMLVKRSQRSTGSRHRQRPGAPDAARHTRPRTSSDVREVPIEAIDWSSALRSPNRAHVGRLADATSLPLPVVWEVERGKFRGVDGFHRWLVAKAQGDKRIQAEIRHYPQGEQGEKRFDFESIELNIQHGLPLTRYERDRAILRLWRRWGRREDRPDGVTLEDVGRVFNLTKQRVGQIIQSNGADTGRTVLAEVFGGDVSTKPTGFRT